MGQISMCGVKEVTTNDEKTKSYNSAFQFLSAPRSFSDNCFYDGFGFISAILRKRLQNNVRIFSGLYSLKRPWETTF